MSGCLVAVLAFAYFMVIAASTNYDSKKNFFDKSAVETVIKLVIEHNPGAIMIIKSTIPIGCQCVRSSIAITSSSALRFA